MNLDETIHHVLESLGDRLRAELQTAADQIAEAAAVERQQLTDEARALAERESASRASISLADAQQQTREAAARAHDEGFMRGRDAGRESVRHDMRLAELAASERLLDAVRSIGRARSLTETLDTLVSCAGREAPRAAVLLARGDAFRSWRLLGFGAALDSHDALEMPSADAGVIAEAARTSAIAVANETTGLPAPRFAALPHGLEGVAVPLVIGGEVVAVLYADQGGENQDADASLPEPNRAWDERLEVLARYAARCLETLTAFNAARALVERPRLAAVDSPARPSSGGVRRDRGEADAADADAADADAAARRYARLLVSEIKLYHEASVVAGRRERDLATRLADEIARARTLYEQRVAKDLRDRTNYFDAELVRTLADGDAELLHADTAP